jgi:cytochrome c biogenesis protein CcdA
MVLEAPLLGLINGLNLCNLSVAALLASTAYSSGLSRARIATLAAAFLGSQALAYFLLGVGLLGALGILEEAGGVPQHLVTRIAASIMLIVGGAVLVNALWPGTVTLPRPPAALSKRVESSLYSLGVLGAAATGALMALHSIPCSCTGGVYFTFLSSISGSSLRVAELLVYVLFYTVPPALVLAVSLNRRTYTYVSTILGRGRVYRAVLGVLMALVATALLLSA